MLYYLNINLNRLNVSIYVQFNPCMVSNAVESGSEKLNVSYYKCYTMHIIIKTKNIFFTMNDVHVYYIIFIILQCKSLNGH